MVSKNLFLIEIMWGVCLENWIRIIIVICGGGCGCGVCSHIVHVHKLYECCHT